MSLSTQLRCRATPVEDIIHRVPVDVEKARLVPAREVAAGDTDPVGIHGNAKRAGEACVEMNTRARLSAAASGRATEKDQPIILQSPQQPVHRLLRHIHISTNLGPGHVRPVPQKREKASLAGPHQAILVSAKTVLKERLWRNRKAIVRNWHR